MWKGCRQVVVGNFPALLINSGPQVVARKCRHFSGTQARLGSDLEGEVDYTRLPRNHGAVSGYMEG